MSWCSRQCWGDDLCWHDTVFSNLSWIRSACQCWVAASHNCRDNNQDIQHLGSTLYLQSRGKLLSVQPSHNHGQNLPQHSITTVTWNEDISIKMLMWIVANSFIFAVMRQHWSQTTNVAGDNISINSFNPCWWLVAGWKQFFNFPTWFLINGVVIYSGSWNFINYVWCRNATW